MYDIVSFADSHRHRHLISRRKMRAMISSKAALANAITTYIHIWMLNNQQHLCIANVA